MGNDDHVDSIYELMEEINQIIQDLGQRSGHSVDMAQRKLRIISDKLRKEMNRRSLFEEHVTMEILRRQGK